MAEARRRRPQPYGADTALYLSGVEDQNTQLPKLGFVSGKSTKRFNIAVMYEGMQGQHLVRK
jgi:hypothetical protein